MKNSSDSIGNRTRDRPACSAVPQPNAPPRTPVVVVVVVVVVVEGEGYMPTQTHGAGGGITATHSQRRAYKGANGQHHAPATLAPRKDPVSLVQEGGWDSRPV